MGEEAGMAGGAEVLVRLFDLILNATIALRTKSFDLSDRGTIVHSSPYNGFHNLRIYCI